MNAGGALLARLKALGVDYIFANSVTDFPPLTDFTLVAAANRAWAKRVETRPDLAAALEQAIGIVENEKRVALLDIAVAP